MTSKNIIFFVAGLLTGVAGTYVVMAHKTAKRVQEKIKAVYDECDEHMRRQAEEWSRDDEYSTLSDDADRAAYYISKLRDLGLNIDDSGLWGEEDGDEALDYEENVNPPIPEIIPEMEFVTDQSYTKEQLLYFRGDNTLCDDEYEVIAQGDDDISKMVGLEFKKVEGDAAYVRNYDHGIDYEIQFEKGSYKAFVETGHETEEEDASPAEIGTNVKDRMAD